MAKMGRRKIIEEPIQISLKIAKDDWQMLMNIAENESTVTGRCVTAQQLVRQAVNFTYRDGERMREVFQRVRYHARNHIRRQRQGRKR